MSKKVKKTRLQQHVTLTFNDGSKAIFAGPAVCPIGDPRRIVDISFTPPEELPDGDLYTIDNVPGYSPLLD